MEDGRALRVQVGEPRGGVPGHAHGKFHGHRLGGALVQQLVEGAVAELHDDEQLRGAGVGGGRVERRRVDSESTSSGSRVGELNSSAKARAVSCLDKYNKFYRNVVTSSRHAEC